MANGILRHVNISCIACAMPKNKMSKEDFMEYYGPKLVNRFEKITGIKQCYWVHEKQTASDLCYVASQKILEQENLSGKDIDVLIFLTQTPDYKTPSTAFILQQRLGMDRESVVFDINMGCTAVVHGIYVMAGLLQNMGSGRGLVLIGDAIPKREITEDHTNSMMFSDAGSAILMECGDGEVPYLLKSDGSGFQAIMNPRGERFPVSADHVDWRTFQYYMDGQKVFNFSVESVPEAISEFCTLFSRKLEVYDAFVFHQANQFILRHIAEESGISQEKLPLSIQRYANTNGASILVTLVDELSKGKKKGTQKVMICGFGVGLSWGIMELSVKEIEILPMIFTDEYFKQGTDIQYLK